MLVVSRPDSGILTPRDLEGKKLGAPTITGNINYATEYWLKKKGVNISKITFRQVNTPLMPDQLKAGRIDAAEVQEPYLQLLLSEGYHKVGYPLQIVGNPAYMGSWISAGQWAKSHSNEVKHLKAGLAEADKWITDHPKKTKDVIAKHTSLSRSLLAKTKLSKYSTTNTVETLKQWDPVLRSVGNFKRNVNYEKIVFNP
jgi:NitT/TauT family transport system substrate-binding protein